MPARFLLVWLILTMVTGVYMYVIGRRDQRTMRKIIKRWAIASAVALLLVVPLFLLNNISGV